MRDTGDGGGEHKGTPATAGDQQSLTQRVGGVVRHVFAAPPFADEHDRRAAALANAVLWILLARSVLYGLGTMHLRFSLLARAPLLFALVTEVLCLRGLRRGWLRSTSVVLVAAFLLNPMWYTLRSGGVHAPGIFSLFLAVVLAGQLLGVGAALLATAISIAFVTILVLLEMKGMLPAPLVVHTDPTYGFAVVLNLAAMGGVSALSARLMIEMVRDLRREQKALRAANDYIRETVDAIPDAVVTLDARGLVLQTNRAHERLLGCDRGAILGKPFLDQIDIAPGDMRGVRSRIAGLQAGQQVTLFTTRFRRKDGDEVFAEVNPRLVDRADGSRTVELVVRDVTERVRAERRQRKLELQLSDARRVEYLGRLAGGVAHDFNNVLTVFLGNADLGLHSSDLKEMRRLFAELQQAASYASRFTRQLLTFARRQPIEPRVLNLGETVRNLDCFLRRLLPERLEIRVEVDENHVHVRADPGQIEQVVVNLVANARDAMPSGGQITVDVHSEVISAEDVPGPLPPGHYVVLTVKDTGRGMDDDTLAHAFEPFFTTKPEGQGTGLGLVTVQGIVEESGGHIFASSRPAAGSVFAIYLPAAEETQAPAGVAESREGWGVGTIIVVDDQAPVRAVVARALVAHGYRVVEAGNSDEALKQVESMGRPSLLVTDVVMPGESGPRLAKRLRALYPDLPVLFMSGYADGESEAEAASVTGAGFIGKPFSPDELLTRVFGLLQAAGLPAPITH